MAWDWEADGQDWVPATPQMLGTGMTGDVMRVTQSSMLRMPWHQISMVSTMPKPWLAKGKKKMVKIGQQGVPQKVEVTVLAEHRMQPCD